MKTKEEERETRRIWERANPDKMAGYRRKAAERIKIKRKAKGRISWRKNADPEKDRQLFDSTIYLGEGRITAYQFMRLSPEKIAKLDLSKIKVIT